VPRRHAPLTDEGSAVIPGYIVSCHP
jgi:hypothetical protein